MVHEDFLIDAIKYVVTASCTKADLVNLDEKIDSALKDFEDTHNVKLILTDVYDVKQSFQKLRDECQRIFETEINDTISHALGTVQETFNSQLDMLEQHMTEEIIGEDYNY